MEITNAGMGVVTFRDAFEIDKALLYDYMSWLDEEREETFRVLESGDVAVNQTGFKFDVNDLNRAPGRFLDLKGIRSGRNAPDEFIAFVDHLEDTAYNLLVEYCTIFPDAATTSWWRPSGHIATYVAGQEIGPHCDDQVPFEWGERPPNQVSMHNSVSINLYLNDCGTDFHGGEIHFPHANHVHPPMAGSAAVYPTNYVGRHEVFPVTSGMRLCFLTMACYGVDHVDPNSYVGQPMGDARIWMPNLQMEVTERRQAQKG